MSDPDLKADLDAIRLDGARWPEFGAQAKTIADDAGKLTLNLHNDLINRFISAYNSFCATFSSRANAGNTAMTDMGHAIINVANTFQAADQPG